MSSTAALWAAVRLATPFLLAVVVALYAVPVFNSDRQSLVYICCALYPTLLTFGCTVLVWRSQFWYWSRGVGVLLVWSMLLMLLLFVLLIVLESDLQIYGVLLLAGWALLLVSGLLSLLWSRVTIHTLLGQLLTVVGVCALVAAQIAGSRLGYGMLTFSSLCWLAILSLLAYGFILGPETYSLRFGVLPVWTYGAKKVSVFSANPNPP